MTNLCEAGYDEIGFTRPGRLAEYVVVPARQVHSLPHNASFIRKGSTSGADSGRGSGFFTQHTASRRNGGQDYFLVLVTTTAFPATVRNWLCHAKAFLWPDDGGLAYPG